MKYIFNKVDMFGKWASKHVYGLVTSACLVMFAAMSWKTYGVTDYSKLGPIGDFWGGLMNPVFGFITMLLFFNSWRVQQSQAEDSRAQLKLSYDEYDRRQIEDALQHAFDTHSDLLRAFISGGIQHGAQVKHTLRDSLEQDATSRTHRTKAHGNQWRTASVTLPEDLKAVFERLYFNMTHLRRLASELLVLTRSAAIKYHLIERVLLSCEDCLRCGILMDEEYEQVQQVLDSCAFPKT